MEIFKDISLIIVGIMAICISMVLLDRVRGFGFKELIVELILLFFGVVSILVGLISVYKKMV